MICKKKLKTIFKEIYLKGEKKKRKLKQKIK